MLQANNFFHISKSGGYVSQFSEMRNLVAIFSDKDVRR